MTKFMIGGANGCEVDERLCRILLKALEDTSMEKGQSPETRAIANKFYDKLTALDVIMAEMRDLDEKLAKLGFNELKDSGVIA